MRQIGPQTKGPISIHENLESGEYNEVFPISIWQILKTWAEMKFLENSSFSPNKGRFVNVAKSSSFRQHGMNLTKGFSWQN